MPSPVNSVDPPYANGLRQRHQNERVGASEGVEERHPVGAATQDEQETDHTARSTENACKKKASTSKSVQPHLYCADSLKELLTGKYWSSPFSLFRRILEAADRQLRGGQHSTRD